MFRKSDAYFVSDKVLLQTKKLPLAFLHTNKGGERRSEGTQTQREGKSNEKKVQIRSLVLFLPSIFVFLLSADASRQTRFFLLTIFIFRALLLLNSLVLYRISGGFSLFLNLYLF